jgi:hypothetical protein
MREANFFTVFVGIESPDSDTLVSMQKKQNTRRSLADSVHKLYRAGMFVTAGFIVGFDSEKGTVAEAMIDCIGATSIPVCMVGLLYALPNTQLTRRLAREERLFPPDYVTKRAAQEGIGDQCTGGLNYETARPRRQILSDYRTVLARIYHPAAYTTASERSRACLIGRCWTGAAARTRRHAGFSRSRCAILSCSGG